MQEFTPIAKLVDADTGGRGWRIRWDPAYPAVLLGDPGWQYDLPGKEVWIQKEDVLTRKNVVVLGERACGIRDFLNWCIEVLQGHPQMFLHGASWLPSLSGSAAKSLPTVSETLEKITDAKGPARKAEALSDWAKDLEHPFYFIIRDFSAIGDTVAFELAQAFRLIRDGDSCPMLHILIGSSSESYFTDDLFSGYLPLTYRYRMRPLRDSEVRKLLATILAEREISATIEEEGLHKIVDMVGGQPFLIQRLFHRLAEATDRGREIRASDVEAAFRLEKRSPPPVVRFWQEDLVAILKKNRELIDPMRAYVAGATLGPASMPPSEAERPLFVAGWLRTRRNGRWGIASEMHAALARPILDRVTGT